ncbi:MAG: carboxypeptidase-like regulatory domain-containing protein [Candidatus Margulisiibacteriota bacterium]|nr:carboxypeptidase-like regulatory domain-containing protein [Candidatus Margulisiibacteriota bacterium]
MRNWAKELLIISLVIGLGSLGFVVGCGQSTDTSTTTTTIPSLSISGTVNFATTSDGIKGGVDVSVTASPTVIATASADANTGTYEVSGLSPGTYTLIASKDGWSIPNMLVTVESAGLTDRNFTANPTNWDVSFISGNPDLNKVASEEISGNNIVIIGKGAGASYYQSTDGGGTWNSGQATTDADSMLDVFLPAPDSIYFFCGSGLVRESSDNGSSWGAIGYITVEAPSIYTKDFASTGNPTSENVGTNGKLYHADDGFTFTEAGDNVTGFNAVAAWVYSGSIYRVAVGDSGKLRYYDGSNWNIKDYSGAVNFQDVHEGESWAAGERYVTVAGCSAADSQGVIFGMWPSTSSGNIILQGVPYSLNGIWSPSTAIDTSHAGVIVVGDNGLILIGK